MLGDPAFNTVYRRAKDFARHVYRSQEVLP